MGQRTTASGAVTLDEVRVPADHAVPFSPIFIEPTVYGAPTQLLHAAIDVGIATGALAEGVRQAAKARPHFEARVQSAAEDPTPHSGGRRTLRHRAPVPRRCLPTRPASSTPHTPS